MWVFGSFSFGVCHGPHQELQSEVTQGATTLLTQVRKVEGNPKESGTYEGCY